MKQAEIINAADKVSGLYLMPELKELYRMCELVQDVHGEFLEVGSLYGRTATLLGLFIKAHRPTTRLYLIESLQGVPTFPNFPFIIHKTPPEMAKMLIDNIYAHDLQRIIQVCAGTSLHFLCLEIPLALVHVDGSHTYADVMTDLSIWASKLVEGGICVCHDYKNTAHPDVPKAIDGYFATTVSKFTRLPLDENLNLVAFQKTT